MKTAIIGLSSPNALCFGEALKERDVEIACVWDYEHSRADEFCRRFGGQPVDDIERIADVGLDGVMVCSRAEDHAKHALPFIAGGVPVYIEEPMVADLGDLDRITAVVKEHGTPVMTPSVLRCETEGTTGDCTALVETFLWMCEVCEPPVPIGQVDAQVRAMLSGG